MKTILFLILVSVAIPQTLRDRIVTLEADNKNLKEDIEEIKSDLNQYYHEIYIKGSKRYKEQEKRDRIYEQQISSSKINAYGTMIGVAVVFILNALGFVHLKKNGKGARP